MRAVVTGVAGFIGSHLAERLLKEGQEVVGIDCFTDYYPRAYKERNLELLLADRCFNFYEANLIDMDLVGLLEDVDYVFHEAAQAGVRASWGENFRVYVENNVLATQRLLEVAKEVKLKKFVYASSSSVYGDAETYPTSEQVEPEPISPYGVTKLAGEHLCQLYFTNYQLPVTILRYFSVYGPRQRPDMAFHKFIKAMLNGEEIVVYGDGEQTRDFTFVDDIVDANILAMEADAVGEVFNIGGGSRVTVNQTIRMLEEIVGDDADVRYVESQRGDVRHTAANISKAERFLGYKPRVRIDEGLYQETHWLRDSMGSRKV